MFLFIILILYIIKNQKYEICKFLNLKYKTKNSILLT